MRGNWAGSSQNEFDYSRRGIQAIFPLLDCRSCEKFGLAHFFNFNFLARKKSWPNRAPILIKCRFSHYTIEKWPSPKFSQLLTLKKRKTDLGTSPRVVRLFRRSSSSMSSRHGAITNLEAKKALFVTWKNVPRKKRPYPLYFGKWIYSSEASF